MKRTSAAPAPTITRTEKSKQGKALRKQFPRAAQRMFAPRPKSLDPIKLLQESDVGRIPGLIPVKYQRMAESAFKFFRGTAIIQARDLASSRVSGIMVQACGDCHLMNFGGYASPERALVFDVNDFDETFPAPWEWDIKRLAASFALAARDRGFSKSIADAAVRAAASSYRERMAEFAEMTVLDTWYAQVNVEALRAYFSKDRDMSARLANKGKQALSQTSEAVIPKLTAMVDGRLRIKDNPPMIYHPQQVSDFEKHNYDHFQSYKQSLPPDRLPLFLRYRLVDAAAKVVGVGSVGTRCYLALFVASENDPLFLQIKEARRSVLESPRGKSRYANQGQRVVTGQRLMQSASDIFLGWFHSKHGHDYYIRQFRDMKVSAEVETFKPRTLVSYASMCGWAVARAHAKGGDAATISGYLGSSDEFDDALAKYAESYADQAERDFATFQGAIRNGRIKTDQAKAAGLDFLI